MSDLHDDMSHRDEDQYAKHDGQHVDVVQDSFLDHHRRPMEAQTYSYHASSSPTELEGLALTGAATATTMHQQDPDVFCAHRLGLYDDAPQIVREQNEDIEMPEQNSTAEGTRQRFSDDKATQKPASSDHLPKENGPLDGSQFRDDLYKTHSASPTTSFTPINDPKLTHATASFQEHAPGNESASVLAPGQAGASPAQSLGDNNDIQDTDSEESDSLFRPDLSFNDTMPFDSPKVSCSDNPGVNSPPASSQPTIWEATRSVVHGAQDLDNGKGSTAPPHHTSDSHSSPVLPKPRAKSQSPPPGVGFPAFAIHRFLGPQALTSPQKIVQEPSAPELRPFHVYVGEEGHKILSHTIQLSNPGRLEDFNGVPEVDIKALRDSPASARWYTEVSQLFWRRVMEHNADLLPPQAALQDKVHSLLCRSSMLIEDLWTAHQVYKALVLKNSWDGNGEPSLLRLHHWMTREADNAVWRTTLAAKTTDYEQLVPWISREWLIALRIILRKGHPEPLVTVDRKGDPLEMPKIKQRKTMARKKYDLIVECRLLYLCQDAELDPQPCAYWAGFPQALSAGQVRIWDDVSGTDHKAEDRAAKAAYDIEQRRTELRSDRGGSVAASVDIDAQDRVRQLEAEVARLQDYVRNMHAHLSPYLPDLPAPDWM